MITSRAWRDTDYPAVSELLSVRAASGLPNPPMLLPGDLAWRLPGSEPEKFLRLYFSGSELAAFAWFEPLTGFEFEISANQPESEALLSEIFDWAQETRLSLPPAYPRFIDITNMTAWRQEVTAPRKPEQEDGYYLTTICPESEGVRIRWLAARGFAPTDHYAPVYLWDLSQPVPEPAPPEGCVVRAVTAADIPARIDVHRAAWVGSQFDARRYAEIRARSSYREDLDIVLEGSGTFGSYCLCWADEHSSIGHFEPVGSRVDWRGQGAARAVILEGLRRLKASGMRWARVSTAGFNAPAQALYESCGFNQVGIERTFMRKLEPH